MTTKKSASLSSSLHLCRKSATAELAPAATQPDEQVQPGKAIAPRARAADLILEFDDERPVALIGGRDE